MPFFSSKVLSVSLIMGLGRDLRVQFLTLRGLPLCGALLARMRTLNGFPKAEVPLYSAASLLPAAFPLGHRGEERAHSYKS